VGAGAALFGSARFAGLPQTDADSNVILFDDAAAPGRAFPGLLVDSRCIHDLTLS
jgi:hypothetical protein